MATDATLQQECIDAHNKKRALHGVPPLRVASDLGAAAQAWADHIAQSGQFGHSHDRDNVGENIAMKWTSDANFVFSGADATDQWYSEITNYTFGTENMNCGHFSQVVWKESTEAGFGRAKAADGKVYIVGQYRPAGNLMGHWSENVLAPQKENAPPKTESKPAATPAAPATPATPAAPAAEGTAPEHGHKKKKSKLLSCFKKSS